MSYEQEMNQYEADMRAYRAALADYSAKKTGEGTARADIVARLTALQAKAESLMRQIEAAQYAAHEALTNTADSDVSRWVSDNGGTTALVGRDNVVERIVDTRFYAATFVTDWGEESGPSKVSDMVEIDQNDSVTITRPSVSTGGSHGDRHIKKWRLYRTNAGTESSSFQFVDEMMISTDSYTDTKKGAELGEVCPTTTWDEPPYRMDAQFDGFVKPMVGSNPFLRGLVGMPNGIMAGFFDNTVAFCEPYHPYAWPVEYQVALEWPAVGLGVFGQTLFVGTTGNPYFISGSDSASMSAQKLDSTQACASARSIALVQGGVLYASPDGLCLADPNGVTVVSTGLYTREDWQKLNPASMIAAAHENIYYLFFNNGAAGCLAFDLVSKKLGRVDMAAQAVFTDTLTDTMYIANDGVLSAAFAAPTRRTAKWRTAKVAFARQEPLAWLKVYGEQSLPNPVVVRWYGDGVLRHVATVTDDRPLRLPAGRWLEHEVEVESVARVTRVVLAGDTAGLQAL